MEYEGRCLAMLADRLVAARTGLANLRTEHDAFVGLNMKVRHRTASQLLMPFLAFVVMHINELTN